MLNTNLERDIKQIAVVSKITESYLFETTAHILSLQNYGDSELGIRKSAQAAIMETLLLAILSLVLEAYKFFSHTTFCIVFNAFFIIRIERLPKRQIL